MAGRGVHALTGRQRLRVRCACDRYRLDHRLCTDIYVAVIEAVSLGSPDAETPKLMCWRPTRVHLLQSALAWSFRQMMPLRIWVLQMRSALYPLPLMIAVDPFVSRCGRRVAKDMLL